MAMIIGDDAIICSGKTLVFYPQSLSTSAHVQFAVQLEAVLASWIPQDQIQRGDVYEGFYAPERRAALVKSLGHSSRRFTTASDLHDHKFLIFVYYGTEIQSERFDEPADLGETIMKYLEKNMVDFSVTKHRDTHSELKNQSEEQVGLKRVDCTVEVIFSQEV